MSGTLIPNFGVIQRDLYSMLARLTAAERGTPYSAMDFILEVEKRPSVGIYGRCDWCGTDGELRTDAGNARLGAVICDDCHSAFVHAGFEGDSAKDRLARIAAANERIQRFRRNHYYLPTEAPQ